MLVGQVHSPRTRVSFANGKIVLALLTRSRKVASRATTLQMQAASSQPSPQLAASTSGPNTCSKPVYQNAVRNRRSKRVQIARLYPERPSEPLRQARALIDLIRECSVARPVTETRPESMDRWTVHPHTA